MTRKSNILWAGVLMVSSLFAAQPPQPDTNFKHKVLPNGLNYYVKKNAFPEKRASIRLLVRAGSLHEEDDQQGLAHFLEHMLFRGSENFEDWEVINFLESIGAQFGPDTNAFTSFDRTCYMLELPLEKEGVLEKAVHICSDWASKATISNELVEKERTVVADELNRSLKSPCARQFRALFNSFLSNSRYNQRWPIGKKDIVLHGDPQLIRDFYKKWYRPDRMALVVVGDFDEDEVESLIVRYFSDIQKAEEVLTEPDTSLNYPEDSIIDTHVDSEQSVNIGYFWNLFDNQDPDEMDDGVITEQSMKIAAYKAIFSNVLSQRFDRASKTNPPPFVATFPMELNIDRIGLRGVAYMPFEDRPYDGLKSVLREMARLYAFGPSQEEYDAAIKTLVDGLKESLANTHRVAHADIAQEFINKYVDAFPVYRAEDKLNAQIATYNEITRQEMVSWLKETTFEPFKHVIYQVSEDSVISKEAVAETIKEWITEDVVDVESVSCDEIIVDKSDVDTTKLTKTLDPTLKYTTVVLENGMKITLQPSDLEKQAVSINFFAQGGKSLLDEKLVATCPYAAEYVKHSGLANLSGHDFENYLRKKNISLSSHIAMNYRTLSVNGTYDHIDNMLALAKASFTDRVRDKDQWELMMSRYREVHKNLDKNPYHYFSEYVSKHYHDNHPAFIQHKPDVALEEDAFEIARRLFSNPTQFEMLIIGDFEADDVLEKVASYFGQTFEAVETNEPEYIIKSPKIESEDVTVYRGAESHCLNYIFYGKDFISSGNDLAFTIGAFDHILTHRLLEKLRKDMGDTYGVHHSTNFPLLPDKSQMVSTIFFGCEPEKSELMKQAVTDEINRFVEEGVTEEELSTAKEILLERQRVAFQSNQGILRAHIDRILMGKDVYKLVDYKVCIDEQVTKECIDEFAKAAFNENRSRVTYSIKPESAQD